MLRWLMPYFQAPQLLVREERVHGSTTKLRFTILKAITLRQPYASALLLRRKRFETRRVNTYYRGLIAIHASIRQPLPGEWDELASGYSFDAACELPRGCILATALLVDCIEIDEALIAAQTARERALGEWRVGWYGWKLEDIRRLRYPVRRRGAPSLWEYHGPSGLSQA